MNIERSTSTDNFTAETQRTQRKTEAKNYFISMGQKGYNPINSVG